MICIICKEDCHADTNCSVPDTSVSLHGKFDECIRVCRSCLCRKCKAPRKEPHSCHCVYCGQATLENKICCACLQPVHRKCASDDLMCHRCKYNKGIYISLKKLFKKNLIHSLGKKVSGTLKRHSVRWQLSRLCPFKVHKVALSDIYEQCHPFTTLPLTFLSRAGK